MAVPIHCLTSSRPTVYEHCESDCIEDGGCKTLQYLTYDKHPKATANPEEYSPDTRKDDTRVLIYADSWNGRHTKRMELCHKVSLEQPLGIVECIKHTAAEEVCNGESCDK